MREVYLDNAATTKICREAQNEIIRRVSGQTGNPSSFHKKGIDAAECLENSRKAIADYVNADAKEIYFTPSGTYSNNIAIFGAVNALKRRGNKIITTQIEHSSVLNVMKKLENDGFEVVYLKPDSKGMISLQDLQNALDEKTILVSIMMVNNETGAILPIDKVKRLINRKSPNALFHTDAVGAFGKEIIDVKKLKIDLMSVSGHKAYAPVGVGFLYVSADCRIVPTLFGGGQEGGFSPGTEPVMLICAFAKAVESLKNFNEQICHAKKLRDYTVSRLENIDRVTINSDIAANPYILNFSVGNIKSETLVNFLSERNIFVSGGSACAKGKQSHVLKAMGLKSDLIDSAVRVSFSRYNTVDDIDILIDNIKTALDTLSVSRKFKNKR